MWITRRGEGLIYTLMGSCHPDNSPAPCHYSKVERLSHLSGQWGSTRISEQNEGGSLDLWPIPIPVGAPMGPGVLSASLRQTCCLSHHWLQIAMVTFGMETWENNAHHCQGCCCAFTYIREGCVLKSRDEGGRWNKTPEAPCWVDTEEQPGSHQQHKCGQAWKTET